MEGLFLFLLSLLLALLWGAQLPCPNAQLLLGIDITFVLRGEQTSLMSQSKRLATSPATFGFTDCHFYRKSTDLSFVYIQHSIKIFTHTVKLVLNHTRKEKY